jgi:hypothetical protein
MARTPFALVVAAALLLGACSDDDLPLDSGAADLQQQDGGADASSLDGPAADQSAPDQSAPDQSAPDQSAPDQSAPDQSAPDQAVDQASPDQLATPDLPGGDLGRDTGPLPDLAPGGCLSNAQCASSEYCAFATQPGCNGPGTCTTTPQICAPIFNQVCGCDGQTYGNPCNAAGAGTNVARPGAC